MASSEKTLWTGSSSQMLNLGVFVLCGLFCWLVVPIFIALWRYLKLRMRRFELTSERLSISEGVFSRRTDDIELYRVKDSVLEQPFWLRLFGLGNIVITTSDETRPVFVLAAVKDPAPLREQLRVHVEARRDQKRVRELDLVR